MRGQGLQPVPESAETDGGAEQGEDDGVRGLQGRGVGGGVGGPGALQVPARLLSAPARPPSGLQGTTEEMSAESGREILQEGDGGAGGDA